MPILGYFFLAEDGDGDLPIGLAAQAFIERDQRVMEPFVDGTGRPVGGGRRLFPKAMKPLEQFGLSVQVRKTIDLEYRRKRICQYRNVMDFEGNVDTWSLHQHQRNIIDADRSSAVNIETGQRERCEAFSMCRRRDPDPDHLLQRGDMPEHRGLPGGHRGIGEGVKSPSFGEGKAPPQPQQSGAVFQGHMRQVPGYGATPVRAVVRIAAQEFPRPVASIVEGWTARNGCVARERARRIGGVVIQEKPRRSDKRAIIVETKMRRQNGPR